MRAPSSGRAAEAPRTHCNTSFLRGAIPRETRKARPIASCGCRSRRAAGPGPPQNRRGSPGISARQAHGQRQPYLQQEAARGARGAHKLRNHGRNDDPGALRRRGRGAGAARRRADAAGRPATRAAARFIAGGAVVLNLVGFVAFRGGRPQPLASTALDAVQIPRRVGDRRLRRHKRESIPGAALFTNGRPRGVREGAAPRDARGFVSDGVYCARGRLFLWAQCQGHHNLPNAPRGGVSPRT